MDSKSFFSIAPLRGVFSPDGCNIYAAVLTGHTAGGHANVRARRGLGKSVRVLEFPKRNALEFLRVCCW